MPAGPAPASGSPRAAARADRRPPHPLCWGAVARSADSLEGTRIGGYQLGKHLGSGGMADVYRASAAGVEGKGRPLAVKILAPELARDARAVARFTREAEAVMRLDHPNVVRIVEVGHWRDRHFIAMDLVAGPPFRRLIADGSEPGKIIGILAQVAEALAHAHERGIVHRDIKPDNVLLTRSLQVRVADFGLARLSDTVSLTTSGQMLGTARYMSPEQAQGRKSGPASDVYSLGVMLYEAITGAPPFVSETAHGFIFKHAAEPPPRPELRPGYPAALGKLALECLAKDPDERPPMDEVAHRLRRALARRSPARLLRWLLAAAAIVLIALAVAWALAERGLLP